jgi:peroxiredoxin
MKKLALIWILALSSNLFAQHKMPNIALKNLKGEIVNSNLDFQKKDVLYVFSFWATWCAPCVQELDAISDIYDDWKSKINIEIIAVSVDDTRTEKRVKPMVKGKGWDYTILLDTNQELKRSLSIANVPYTVVVKNNVIVYIQNGHSPGGELEFFEKLKKL